MNIYRQDDYEICEFQDIEVNATFLYGNDLCLKIHPVRNLDKIIVNAINLVDASPHYIGDHIEIRLVETTKIVY